MMNLPGMLIAVVVVAFSAYSVWTIVSTRTTQQSIARAVVVIAVVVAAFCTYGFYSKFAELIAVYRSHNEGAFAITPILNYILASVGFLFMLVWAAFRGMFHDIEGPKRTLLDNENMLDRKEQIHRHAHRT
jgi:TRAP-type uncharacterized transport system fused permease subunit